MVHYLVNLSVTINRTIMITSLEIAILLAKQKKASIKKSKGFDSGIIGLGVVLEPKKAKCRK